MEEEENLWADFDDSSDEDPTYEEEYFDVVEDFEGDRRAMEGDERVSEEDRLAQLEAERYLRNDTDREYEDGFLERFSNEPGNERASESTRATGMEEHATEQEQDPEQHYDPSMEDDVPEYTEEEQDAYLCRIVQEATANMDGVDFTGKSLDEILKTLDHYYTHYPPIRESTYRTSNSKFVPRTSRRRPMPEVLRAKLVNAYQSAKRYYHNSHALWGKVIDYAHGLMAIKKDDTNPKKYLQNTIFKWLRSNRLKTDVLTAMGNAPRQNGNRSRYLHLEIAVHNCAQRLHPDIQVNIFLAETIVKLCIERIGGARYQRAVDLDGLPAREWIVSVFKGAGYRWRRQAGERDHVDTLAALKKIIPLWPIVNEIPLYRIFNADQTCCEMQKAFSLMCLTKKSSISQHRKGGGNSCTQFPCASVDGYVKPGFFMYARTLMNNLMMDYHIFLDKILPQSKIKACKREAKKKYEDEIADLKRRRAEVADMKTNVIKPIKDSLKELRSRKNKSKQLLEMIRNKNSNAKMHEEVVKRKENAILLDKQELDALITTEQLRLERELLEKEPHKNPPPCYGTDTTQSVYDADLRIPDVREQSSKLAELRKLDAEWKKIPAKQPERREEHAKKMEGLFREVAMHYVNAKKLTGRPEGETVPTTAEETPDPLDIHVLKQEKGYMDTVMMVMWLYYFSVVVKPTDYDPAVLILDNVGFHRRAHKIVKGWPEFEHIKFVFLPPNSTPFTQPMDLGIIGAMKQNWRRYEKIFLGTVSGNDGDSPEITWLHRLNWLGRAWNDIPAATIFKCSMQSPLFFTHPDAVLPSFVKRNMTRPPPEEEPEEEAPPADIGLGADGSVTKKQAIATIRALPLADLFPPGEDVLEAELLEIEADKVCPTRKEKLDKKTQEYAQCVEDRKRCADLLEIDTDGYFEELAANDPHLARARRRRQRVRRAPASPPGSPGSSDSDGGGDDDDVDGIHYQDAFQVASPPPTSSPEPPSSPVVPPSSPPAPEPSPSPAPVETFVNWQGPPARRRSNVPQETLRTVRQGSFVNSFPIADLSEAPTPVVTMSRMQMERRN